MYWSGNFHSSALNWPEPVRLVREGGGLDEEFREKSVRGGAVKLEENMEEKDRGNRSPGNRTE